jgi:hypothetical protein
MHRRRRLQVPGIEQDAPARREMRQPEMQSVLRERDGMGVLMLKEIAGILLLDSKAYHELEQDNSFRPFAVVYAAFFILFFPYIPLNGLFDVIYHIISAFVFSLFFWFILTSVLNVIALLMGARSTIEKSLSLVGYSFFPLIMGVLPYPGTLIGALWCIACLIKATQIINELSLAKAFIVVMIPVIAVFLIVFYNLLPYDLEAQRNIWRMPPGYIKGH